MKNPPQPRIPVWLGLISFLFLVCGASAQTNARNAEIGNSSPPVTLTQNEGTVVLDNGIVRATIQTATARVISIKYEGREMVETAANRKHIYFSLAGGPAYEQPSRCVLSVVRQGPDIIDISCKRVYDPSKGDKHAWDIDIHYVLRRGISGLYAYAILDHPAHYPEVGMGEWRTVWWMPTQGDNYLMERIYVDKVRNWEMPSSTDLARAERTGFEDALKLTTGPRAGRFDYKYAYNAEYENVGTYGFASNRNNVGAWMVLGGYDYFNDGPGKQDLGPALGIIHLHLYRNHYGSPGFTIKQGQGWSKIYGPWLLYFNNKTGADANWADAKAQVEKEKAQWPYSWLSHPLYPSSRERGAVTGKVIVNDRLKPSVSAAGAWVGLALPAETAGHWQMQGADYQYWVQAKADGSFSIPAVRPGNYSLYAFTDGAVGHGVKTGVAVKPGETLNLNTLTWNVAHRGNRIAWEIGVPNRTTTEFKHGGTDYWEPFLHRQFSAEFPNPLEYDVSKRNWGTAWNYAHNAYLSGDQAQPWKWRINFELDRVPSGDATLTLAFAGAHDASLDVYVNDETQPLTTVKPPVMGGNALIRESNHAKYSVSYVKIPTTRVKVGANTISLVQTNIRSAASHVMYDYLSLELP
ncbi:MAG: hypothetical protein KY445_08465 [Armatimonadetes bacterium]|nr:hypothetical protein [Armatimonadota bacterium]